MNNNKTTNMKIYIFILSAGFLTNFISAPVIAAFTSAVSINVMTSQIKGLLGLKKVNDLQSHLALGH